MQSREPSMEDILASIKRVIAEEKELRASVPQEPASPGNEEDVLELDETMEEHETATPPAELGPPLLDEDAADTTRGKLEELSSLAASTPPPQPQGNPLEEMLREMLRPMLKQWLDDNLPRMVEEHVKREISRITGRPL